MAKKGDDMIQYNTKTLQDSEFHQEKGDSMFVH